MAKTTTKFKNRRALVIAGALLVLLSCCLLMCSCVADEVVLTNEWQLLGENDTIPAGAHVRMDLSNGGRWAKLVEEDDEDDDDENEKPSQVQIDASGGITTVEEEKIDPSTTNENQQEFDYDMMHRALSHLPKDEQERMGGLPEKPLDDNDDPEVRKAFEERMKEIWTQRQAELQQLQEEAVADLPQLLSERIKHINSYLQDPQAELSQVWKDEKEENEGVSHIVSVLQDLEYHFSDIDMTRDFHSLGGWKLLASLLSDAVHQSPNATTALTPEQLEKVHDVQSNAAWAMGTAVKNIGEFAPWATEELVIDGVQTTPLQLLSEQIKNVNDDGGGSNSSNALRKRQRILYALGSMLRGNRMAQVQFCADDGPAVLGRILFDSSQDPSTADPRLTKRILSLADDIVSDVVLHPYEQDENVDQLVIASFSTDDWCESPIRLLERNVLQESALEAIETLESYCKWDKDLLRTSLAKVKEARKDDEHIVELADSILQEV